MRHDKQCQLLDKVRERLIYKLMHKYFVRNFYKKKNPNKMRFCNACMCVCKRTNDENMPLICTRRKQL